ncbi:MAG: bifunctional phosphopantothenoylcysteine decarboxylase/phosphopantothenate--cysteine ligase CoaBC [Candidatus Margulisbacteria bacterium]|jgi:phosphopantothenoylcysteine decarboxylase/phosphopantothenate--cysteine ligase|nr:bifunctional phosphopantothenoylcysteine decarboxylase/phosphopantothenate--cysteine ligase CoaBC [Candidatus Margulisiibacteriota bacterium]
MAGRKIIVGITGGIACYKAAGLVSLLKRSGYTVQVVLTEAAAKFVTPVTFRALSRNPVCSEQFASGGEPVPHIALAEDAALYVVAPATANTIAKLAHGLADNILTASFLAAACPKLLVPSMNTGMWENVLTQENIQKLRKHGCTVLEPESGPLACGTSGTGRYPANQVILAAIQKLTGAVDTPAAAPPLRGKKLIITGGGTREPLDPVRTLTNNSSGRMGLALKAAAEQAGAEVVYIDAGAVDGVQGLKAEIAKNFAAADALIMAAAVSDYRPAAVSKHKIKAGQDKLTIELVKTEDILKYFAGQKKDKYIVGFALESADLLKNAAAKLKAKKVDLLVANDTSALGSAESAVVLLDGQNQPEALDRMPKTQTAEKIIERVGRHFSRVR